MEKVCNTFRTTVVFCLVHHYHHHNSVCCALVSNLLVLAIVTCKCKTNSSSFDYRLCKETLKNVRNVEKYYLCSNSHGFRHTIISKRNNIFITGNKVNLQINS